MNLKDILPLRWFLAPLFLLAAALFAPAQAQTYGNEWIVPGQQYYKIQTTKNGIHRLTYDWLIANVQGAQSRNPQEYKLYRRGVQQSIFIEGEADGQLNQGDYIEFYGERNDGKLDVAYFKNPAHHINPYYSNYTDSAAYFLTWNAGPGNRMTVTNPDPAGLPAEQYHQAHSSPFNLKDLTASPVLAPIGWPNQYSRGQRYTTTASNQLAWGDEAEGWGFVVTPGNNARNYRIDSLINIPAGADTAGLPKPTIKMVFTGGSIIEHKMDILVGRSTNVGQMRRIASDVVFGPWDAVTLTYTLYFKDILQTNGSFLSSMVIRVVPKNSHIQRDRVRFIVAEMTYPQKFDLAGKPRIIYPDPNKPLSHIQVTNAPADAIAYDITNLQNITRITGTVNGNQESFVFANNGAPMPRLYVASGSSYLTPVAVRPVAFANISASDRNYIIISHKDLMQPTGSSTNPVQEFADYRSGISGGSYKTVIADVEQVYNQFHYGEKSSLGIRNYIDYMLANSDLQFVFLLGKGLQMGANNNQICTDCFSYRQNPDAFYEKDLVPPFGYPGSDLVYVMDFKNDDYKIKVPIGRIAAQTPEQALNYLEKVKGYEAQPQNAAWRKNLMHLGGGQSPQEITRFRTFLRSYQALAEGIYLGANVLERYRTSIVNPVQPIDIAQEVNAGLSLMNYFGHSSATVVDLDIGFASDPAKGYNNVNKYPTLLMNGCATGNAYGGATAPDPPTASFGEDWTMTKNKGAIAFMAHVATGFDTHFHILMREFYQAAYKDSTYGHPIGEVQQQTWARVSNLQNLPSDIESFIALLTQYNLQGDPAVVFYGPQKPDYDVTHQAMVLENSQGGAITADADSFKLTIPVRNLGKALPLFNKISISMKRTFSDGTTAIDTFLIDNVHYATTVTHTFPAGGSVGGGLNTFEVFVDNTNAYDEISEANNIAKLEYFVPLTGVSALFPAEFGIVPNQQVILKGQANNLASVNQQYVFEIDTTHTFNSPWKKSADVTANMLPTWQVTLLNNPMGDSIEYFWRVRYKILQPGESELWSTSSFTHIPNSPTGWAQGHPGQFKRDSFDKLTHSETTRKWNFTDKKLKIELKTAGGGVLFNAPPHGILLNDNDLFKEPVGGVTSCALGNAVINRNRFLVVVLDPVTFAPITDIDSQYLCGNFMQFHTFPAMQLASSQNDLANFLNIVPDGAYVAMVSVNSIGYSTFTPDLKNAFAALGATQIATAPDTSGYLLVARKGNYPFVPVERTANPADTTDVKLQNVSAVVELSAPEMPGTIMSTVIGPAMDWGSLYHTIKEVQATDEVQLSVFVRSLTGQDSLFVADVNTNGFSLNNINATQYPYLRLQLILTDSVQFVPAQLKRWLVTYTPAPEGVARPDILGPDHYTLTTPFDAGQTVSFRFKFHNISDASFRDPVRAVVTLTSGNQQQQIDTVMVGNVAPDSIAEFTYEINTANLDEDNSLLVYVNPRLQPEQYYSNNIMQASFKVRRDNLHPIIDVVFDGKHIMDGDIIAPDPTIVITMKDENKYRFKDDTVGVKVELVRQPEDGSAETRQVIDLVNNPDVQVQYATANSDFRVVYTPDFLPDGLYTLEVQGADKTGNMAGTAPYRISFRMVNASTITQFYPYPNPFSNSCKFVFTLTGQPELTKMKIQIITVTGKVVREITSAELGTFKAGDNITDYSWDGTDEYGDKLANGVYLYRVVIGDKGDNFKDQEIKAAKYQAEAAVAKKAFKKGYGKLYILR